MKNKITKRMIKMLDTVRAYLNNKSEKDSTPTNAEPGLEAVIENQYGRKENEVRAIIMSGNADTPEEAEEYHTDIDCASKCAREFNGLAPCKIRRREYSENPVIYKKDDTLVNVIKDINSRTGICNGSKQDLIKAAKEISEDRKQGFYTDEDITLNIGVDNYINMGKEVTIKGDKQFSKDIACGIEIIPEKGETLVMAFGVDYIDLDQKEMILKPAMMVTPEKAIELYTVYIEGKSNGVKFNHKDKNLEREMQGSLNDAERFMDYIDEKYNKKEEQPEDNHVKDNDYIIKMGEPDFEELEVLIEQPQRFNTSGNLGQYDDYMSTVEDIKSGK